MLTEPSRAAVVGSPVAHSLSPVLHLAAYRALGLDGWTYDRIERDAAGLPGLVASLGPEWAGLSVTMPGKQAALRVAGAASARAVAVGAANTLVRKPSGEWHADCTDVDGVVGALRAVCGDIPPGTGVVLGAGGTACAALAGLVDLGIRTISVVVRDPSRATDALACADRLGVAIEVIPWDSADFAALAAFASVLVNTTPAAAVASKVDSLAAARRVLDVIYHPWPTALAEAVHRQGGRVATGLDMLLHQAFAQVEQFTGRAAPRAAMRDALRSATGNTLDLPLDPTSIREEELRARTVDELKPFATKVIVEDYNPEWPDWYAAEEARIAAALGPRALRIEHTGSTSVPGLPAKPVIDILLVVPDSTDEPAYIPLLEAAGYTLRAREPTWYEHRLLYARITNGAPHDVNIHVFSPDTGAPEIERMLTFRDWLRTHPRDRDHYAQTKRSLAQKTWKYVQDYADAKTPTIQQILTRASATRP